jgi:hypothetical protein
MFSPVDGKKRKPMQNVTLGGKISQNERKNSENLIYTVSRPDPGILNGVPI